MLILVDNNDKETGTIPKMEAHEKGLRHRAFSVFIFNTSGELLLQQRAWDKYHSPGLWTNTCCSHPFPGEDIKEAASRRLKEEMGVDAPLNYLFKFEYREKCENNLVEHEIDYVFSGKTDKMPVLNPVEVVAFKYMNIPEIKNDIEKNPGKYTVWFRIILKKFYNEITKIQKD